MPIEERIEPYNSKLLLIPTNSGSLYYHRSWKTKTVFQENHEEDHYELKGKKRGSYFYQPKFVTFCSYFYWISKYYT